MSAQQKQQLEELTKKYMADGLSYDEALYRAQKNYV